MIRRLLVESLRPGLLCIPGLLLLSGCGDEPTEIRKVDTGVWMLANGHHVRDGVMTACRPMLMELVVSTDSVTLGPRAFPCDTDSVTLGELQLERDGESLRMNGEEVGTLLGQTLEITLPDGGGSISWDVNRANAPYQESSPLGVFSAKPELRLNSSPVAISSIFSGTEDQPFEGRVHAARLPDTPVKYGQLRDPWHGTLQSFDAQTGQFRLIPGPDFAGVDSFSFTVFHSGVQFPSATIEISFANAPDPLQAITTHVDVHEDVGRVITPSVHNPDKFLYEVHLVKPPAHGKTFADGPSIVYTPDADYNGPDSFTYFADDGSKKSNEATVVITVVPVDDPPRAVDFNVQVTSDSATPIVLQAADVDSTKFTYQVLNMPMNGYLIGDGSSVVYLPDAGFQGTDSFTYHVADESSLSGPGIVNITVAPGPHVCKLLATTTRAGVFPEWRDGSNIYYRAGITSMAPGIGVAGSSQFQVLQDPEIDTFGFDNSIGNARRTTFFGLGSAVYFTTSTTAAAVRFYRTTGQSSEKALEIPSPGNDVASEPSVGEAYVDADAAYLPVYWQTTNSQYACQLWKITPLATQPELVHAFPSEKGPCFGMRTLAAEQYMFVGSNIVKFAGMASPPVVVHDLGVARPMPWMVEAGGKLFFQTRTAVGTDTQIDLWVTDGTPAGTKLVKQIETAFFEFDIFSPVAFSNKLYFAHRKSLWSSDGTEAGTNIVATIPVTSVVGNGAIGTISPIGGRLYFLATSNAAGREPWVSDGTAAGTNMLKDIRMGSLGSTTASTNPVYFHEWNGQILFLAHDGAGAFGLWTTDGTSAGTNLFVKRPMTTIVGVVDNQLLYHDDDDFFSMSLQ